MIDLKLMDSLFEQACVQFDWARAARTYAALDWRWVLCSTGIPQEADIQNTVRGLYRDLREYVQTQDLPFYAVTTGGMQIFFSPAMGGILSIEMVAVGTNAYTPVPKPKDVEVTHPTNYVKEG